VASLFSNTTLQEDLVGDGTLLTVSWSSGAADFWNQLKTGMKLKIDEELLYIEEVLSSTEQHVRLQVHRGLNGTSPVRHFMGDQVWVIVPFGDNAMNQIFSKYVFTPAFTSVHPVDTSSYGGELITLAASGFNATLLASNLHLRTFADPGTNLKKLATSYDEFERAEYYGIAFDVFANRTINITGFDVHLYNETGPDIFWLFSRASTCTDSDCGFEGYQDELSAWTAVDGNTVGFTVTPVADATGRISLSTAIKMSHGRRLGFLLFGRQGIRFEDDMHPEISCPGGKGVRCTEFTDTFLNIQPGVLVNARSAQDGTYPQDVLNVIGTARFPRFFTGGVYYSSTEIVGDKYRCRFEELGTARQQDTPITRAFSANYMFPVVAPEIVCAMPQWEYAETLFNLKVIAGDGNDEILYSPVMSGTYTDFPYKRLAIWWSLSGSTSGNSKGGNALYVDGLGFDSDAKYIVLFRNAFHEEQSNLTVINSSFAKVHTPR